MEIYSGIESLHRGMASDVITPGCLILEGGAWRGIYTQGLLDAWMEADLNFQTVIGVSAGAMSGFSYVSGQIGRSGRINLTYRHDSHYCGIQAMKDEHGITGFQYMFHELNKAEPLDEKRFFDPKRRFIAAATNIHTGAQEYFEKGKCEDIFLAIQASATVPYISRPVAIDGKQYLDGGIAEKIPLDWALNQNFEKIVIVKTRDHFYRKPAKKPSALIDLEYHAFPQMMQDMKEEVPHYNLLLDRIDALHKQGRLFAAAPSEPVTISRFEGDMDKLGALYWLGYHDGQKEVPALKEYLAE